MSTVFSKQFVLMMYCYCRQAERSIHYAVSCPNQWKQFCEYYSEQKRRRLRSILHDINAREPSEDFAIKCGCRDWIPALELPRLLVRSAVNQFRSSWSFDAHELDLVADAIRRLLAITRDDCVLSHRELLQLRKRFFECSYAIERKLIGLIELRRASRVEHWFNSESTQFYTIEELGLPPE